MEFEGEVSGCNPVHGAYVFIRIAKPKRFCPNVLIKKHDDTAPAYIGKKIKCYFSISRLFICFFPHNVNHKI